MKFSNICGWDNCETLILILETFQEILYPFKDRSEGTDNALLAIRTLD